MSRFWTELDIRDDVVETIMHLQEKTGIKLKRLLRYGRISRGKFYEWKKRYGIGNQHNGKIPRANWLLEEEKQAIIEYARNNIEEGYRRLTYRMIDENVAYVSPSSVYRLLKAAGLLSRFNYILGARKGMGYIQPKEAHKEWHIDISYINVRGTFMFLIAIIDGYSRFIVHHDLRASMEEKDVEFVVQKAHEHYPDANPRLISDRGGQFISKDFKEYLRNIGLKQVFISAGYPQSNGKLERFFRSLKTECIRTTALLSIPDARAQIDNYIWYYNHRRLHSAIFYITPWDMLNGKKEEILAVRNDKLHQARLKRMQIYNEMNESTLPI